MQAAYCPYCHHEVDELTKEHVIPQQIGGNLTIGTCGPCNRGSAACVDNPVLSYPDVEILRGLHDIRSPKRRSERPRAQIAGHFSDGSRALYRPGRRVDLIQVLPSDPIDNGDGTFTYAVPVKDAEFHTERVRRRLELENPDRTVTIDPIGVQRTRVAFEHRFGLAPWIWPRFAAKVAVALLSEIMPDAWLGSPTNLGLLALFRKDVYVKGLLAGDCAITTFPQDLGEGDYEYEALAPWEHLLVVVSTDKGIGMTGTLFGELRFAISLESELQPDQDWAWHIDTRQSSPTSGPLADIIDGLDCRMSDHGPATRLHLNRPRGQVLGLERRARVAPQL